MSPRRWLLGLVASLAVVPSAFAAEKQKPLMKDFMGLNVHTINFKPALYRPTCELVRDYHNLHWDVGDDPSTPTQFPKGEASKAHWLDWEKMYGSWKEAGIRIDVCVQWHSNDLPPAKWGDKVESSAFNYGKSFAQFFGPNGKDLVEAVEIGNEPGDQYDHDTFMKIFVNMAKGIREGDPKLKIATPTVNVKGDRYSKPLSHFVQHKALFDIINVHQYALKTGYPTWERSYPEDMSIEYVPLVKSVIEFRNKHLPGKEIWLTEFGYDASTKPAPATGTFAKWMDVDDIAQARYNVRSFLVFSATDLDRAYLYFFNDNDEPSFHASSGITRNFQPKPSYHAMAHLYKTLGEYRFSKVVKEDKGKLFVFEYTHGQDPKEKVYVAWSPTATPEGTKGTEMSIELPAKPLKAERMPLEAGDAPEVSVDNFRNRRLQVLIDGSPVYIRVRLP
jgi:hypothetical protein